MDTQFYETMLQNRSGRGPDEEAAWDLRARNFGESQKRSGIDQSGKVTELLLEKGLLKGLDVLDVGGGTGRYAVPFAAHANEVTVADISTQMLQYAKENAESAGRSNLRYEKLGWDNTDLKMLSWERRFDLVFASMCPAVRSKEGIDKMSAASRGWCQINQLIAMNDTVSQKLARDLEIERRHDPHNDRDSVQGFFNLLWIQGFEPEITYLRDTARQVLSVEEALPRFSHRFDGAAAAKGVELKNLLKSYASGDGIALESNITLAMIFWKV